MIERLLELPAHVRERLVNALKTGLLVAPYEEAAVRSVLGGDAAAVRRRVCAELAERSRNPGTCRRLGARGRFPRRG